jgi:sortase A
LRGKRAALWRRVEEMRRYRTRSVGRRIAAVISALLIVSGLLLIGYSFLIRDPLASLALFDSEPPEDPTMTLTVPEMSRVDEVPVYDAARQGVEGALHDGTVHIRGTGFPWQRGANVYIAGHRLGFPGTRSYLVFWDLNKLENGDEVILTDANGTRYTYEVFKELIVNPYAYRVTRPVAGRSIVTLQTCTLPDYSQRLIVQAELTDVS